MATKKKPTKSAAPAKKKGPVKKKAPAKKKTTPTRTPRKTPAKKAPAPAPGAGNGGAPPASPGGGGAGAPLAGLRVRMYRVGFGDFFLVSVPSGNTDKHILIDCGVHAKDTHSIAAAVNHMAQETGNQLALIIVTHRHADHVTGFSKCKDVFAKFTVERIWMSFWEDPGNKNAVALQAKIAAVAADLKHSLAARADTESDEYHMVGNITDAMGATGGTQNPEAFAVLHNLQGNPPITYYKAGDTPTLPPSLIAAGLEAQILGPPTDPAVMSKTDNASQEYIASVPATAPATTTGPIKPFDRPFQIQPSDYPSALFDLIPRTLIEARVASVQPDMLAAKAAVANNVINNQSLMTLLTFKGKTLLFAGDAQWGNWANFLFGSVTSTVMRPEATQILGKIDVYKVGHHGSTNATPKDALAAMRAGCVALCSTAVGAYNRVPRDELITAINQRTHNQLARSDQVAAGDAPPDPSAGGPPPGIFKAISVGPDKDKCGYIDYMV